MVRYNDLDNIEKRAAQDQMYMDAAELINAKRQDNMNIHKYFFIYLQLSLVYSVFSNFLCSFFDTNISSHY